MVPASNPTRVILFGSFDPLHDGHRNLFEQARAMGDYLIVVVARDNTISSQKGRPAFLEELKRLAYVAQNPIVDEAILGDSDPVSYSVLKKIQFNVLALGYDQEPSDQEARLILDGVGLSHVRLVRLFSYQPNTYKSSLLRT